MDSETKIYGASDDLIELKGEIDEEFSHDSDSSPAILAFSDGTLLQVEYDDDGIWRIKRLAEGICQYAHADGSVERATPDVVILTGKLRWCVKSERGQYSPCFARAALAKATGAQT